MPRPNFFNDNLNRSYPFREGSVGVNTPETGIFAMPGLPHNVVVDCGFILGAESGFDASIDEVFLYRITRVNSFLFEFEFRCTASNLLHAPLIFTRAADADLFETEFVESITADQADISLSASEALEASASDSGYPEDCGEPLWSGFMVSGDMPSLANRIASGNSVTRSDVYSGIVEPCLIQNLSDSHVVSLNIANSDRTRALRPENCPQNQWDFPVGQTYVYDVCLLGNVKFKAGFNISINQDVTASTLVFAPGVGTGDGQPCNEIAIFPGETPPIGSENELLAGDFYCNEVFRAVNGLQGPTLTFFGESGVSILTDIVNHKLIVDINLNDLSVCDFSFNSISL
jgi:hypothetical protein